MGEKITIKLCEKYSFDIEIADVIGIWINTQHQAYIKVKNVSMPVPISEAQYKQLSKLDIKQTNG